MSERLIFLIDDDRDLLASAADWLEVNDFRVSAFAAAGDALAALARESPLVVVSDIRMPGMDGMSLLHEMRRRRPEIPVVLLTGHGEVSLAVRAIKAGAEDFLEKPYDADHLVAVLDKAIGRRAMNSEIGRLQALVHAPSADHDGIVGNHPSVARLKSQVRTLAGLDIDVLIVGETGTGKELVARSLHEASARASRPFVAINCAAIPETVFESELFGHARGAFTGADKDRVGRFEFAQGGTVLLDEIESMPLPMQAKLLRVLQERCVERLGENTSRPLDVRIVTAAKEDLRRLASQRLFREDLYYRLNVASVHVPPLRERGEDILLLYAHFASLARRRYGRPDEGMPAVLARDLLSRDWPGNVRELKARAERDALGIGWEAGPGDDDTADPGTPGSLNDAVRAFEAARIREALAAAGGEVREAARLLGIPRRTLSEKISRLGIRTS